MNPLLLLFLFVYMTSPQRVDEANYYAAYMVAMVKEQTVSACEGQILSIRCPSMTTISILAASYGRREEKCQTTTQGEDDITVDDDVTNKCKPQQKSTTSLKSPPRSAASECDEKRFCEIVVKRNDDGGEQEECGNFTYLYLQVKYKCRIVTDELKRKVSCSGDSIKLRCPQRIPDTNYFLYVYDVIHAYNSECETNYPSTMSYCNETEMGMMKLISNECFNKTRCSIHVPRDLCNNSVQISYLCLPQQILTRRKPHQIYKFLQLQKQQTTTTSTHPTTTKSLLPTTTQGNHDDLTPPFSDVTTAIVTSSSITPVVATSSPSAVTSSSGSDSTTTLRAETISTTVKLREERGANQSSMTSSFNVTSQTSSHPLHFITSLVTLMEFVQEHSDRILMITFAITSVFLFLVCIFLLCHYERPCGGGGSSSSSSSKKKQPNPTNNKSHNPSVTSQPPQQQHDDHESTSLLGGPDNVQVHSTAPDGGASKRMAHMWRTHLLGGAWCASCCKTPWQLRRGGRQQAVVVTDADNCYRVVNHRGASSISDDEDDDVDDDIISAVVLSPSANNSHHHPGMMLMTLEGSGGKDETRYGAFPVNRYDEDATSLYEFPDQPNTALQPTTGGGGSNGLYVGSGHVYATTRDRSPMVVASNNTSPRGEPPPFPKPSRYEQQQQQQQQDLKKKLPIIQQPPLRTSTAKFPYHCHHHHHHHPHHGGSTAIVPHYATQRNNAGAQQYRYAQNVMLRHLPTRQGAFPSTFTTQPYHQQQQQRHESTAFVALRHQLTTSSSSPVSGGQQQQQQQVQQERRGSFYDNSLPRDSPLYEYYQSELPGTRNLNQYFS